MSPTLICQFWDQFTIILQKLQELEALIAMQREHWTTVVTRKRAQMDITSFKILKSEESPLRSGGESLQSQYDRE